MSDLQSRSLAQPDRATSSRKRRLNARVNDIYDEVRLRSLMADGTVALAGHIMEEMVGLDQHRRQVAKDQPSLEMTLAEIQETAINQVKRVQRDLFNNWAL